MSKYSNIEPEAVIGIIRSHLIGDGFEFVLDMERSHGSYMVDALTGKELLDFYTCFASNPLGFNHPKVTDAATVERLKIAAINNITNSDLFTDLKAEFIETFYAKAAPDHMEHMFLIAGGALAVENALKAAFDWKGQLNRMRGETRNRDLKVLHFKKAFHGRSGYTLSLTNTEPGKTDLFPKFDWPRIDNPCVIFPDEGEHHEDLIHRETKALEQIKHAVYEHGSTIAACIIEPIQGEGGDNHFRGEFLRELQAVCNENDIMFIVDEIQTGVGMTGRMWAYEHFGVEPDMLCFGKKTQICGFLCSDKIDQVPHNVFNTSGRINSTWGGNLVDMIRCQRYLEIIEEDNLVENARKMGEVLLGELLSLQRRNRDVLSNVRGRGLMCAFDMPDAEKRNNLRVALYKAGMLILACGERSLRFRPALTIGEEDIHKAVRMIADTLLVVS